MRQAHLKGAHGLTRDTCPYLDLVFVVLKEGSEDVSTSAAVELDHLQLREHSCPSCHHPLELDQAVQVMLPAYPELLVHNTVTRPTGLAEDSEVLELQCCSSFYVASEPGGPAAWSDTKVERMT